MIAQKRQIASSSKNFTKHLFLPVYTNEAVGGGTAPSRTRNRYRTYPFHRSRAGPIKPARRRLSGTLDWAMCRGKRPGCLYPQSIRIQAAVHWPGAPNPASSGSGCSPTRRQQVRDLVHGTRCRGHILWDAVWAFRTSASHALHRVPHRPARCRNRMAPSDTGPRRLRDRNPHLPDSPGLPHVATGRFRWYRRDNHRVPVLQDCRCA